MQNSKEKIHPNYGPFHHIPDDVVSIIFSFLSARQLWQLRRLNKYWHGEIQNPINEINSAFEERWERQFNQMLRKTSRYLTSGRLMRVSRTILLSELHPDCSYSGLLTESTSKRIMADPDESINWSPISVAPSNDDDDDNLRKEKMDELIFSAKQAFGAEIRIWQDQRKSQPKSNTITRSIPVLREALERELNFLYEEMCKKHDDITKVVFSEISENTLNIMAHRFFYETQQSNRLKINPEVYEQFLKIVKERLEKRQRLYPEMNGATQTCIDSLIVDISHLSSAKSWINATILLMGDNLSTIDIMFPIIINHSANSRSRDSLERNFQLLRKWKWLDDVYPIAARSMIPLDEMFAYCSNQENETPHSTPSLRAMQELFHLSDGSIHLPVNLVEMKDWKLESTCNHANEEATFEAQWKAKMNESRPKRHCAELYFPNWLIEALKNIGKVSFVESSIFIRQSETSFYMLASQCGPYLVGFIWVKQYLDFPKRLNEY